MKILFIVLAFLALSVASTQAVEPSEMLDDPALEARARDVSRHLRCVVCQNETIDESNAELAKDMRLMVRRRIVAGNSNQQVLDYMVTRYGDFILLKPRFTADTLVLWLGPFVILVIGGVMLMRTLRTRTTTTAALNDEEKAALSSMSASGNATDSSQRDTPS